MSDPRNLKVITPPSMGFEVTSSALPENIYPGLIISYRVRPLFGVPLNWVTEITHINEPFYFVDEQRFGPYAFWHHKHFLRETERGVEMEDLVHFKMPGGKAGDLLVPLIVLPKLRRIFEFRREKLETLFGSP